jgi:tripartite-type tricarboxylate transporter receptor subunit TctC
MGSWLSDRLGQPIIIESKPGGGTNIGTQTVVNSQPDGYTLLFLGVSATINATFYATLPFNLQRDIAPVAGLIDFRLALVAHPSVPAKTVAELIAYAKAHPGKISIGSFGTGTVSHVAGELFKMMTGVNLLHVPYRGSAPLLIDLLSGQVQVAFDVLTTSLPHIRSGALRALAMAEKTRFDQLPDVPTIDDAVPGYEASAWAGVGVPRGTPGEIIERLNREINAGLVNPTIKTRLAEVATTPKIFTAAEFGSHVAAEIEKWGRVIKFAGLRAE